MPEGVAIAVTLYLTSLSGCVCHLIKHLEGETVDPDKDASLNCGCQLVDVSGRRREADGLGAPLRRAVGRRVTAVGRADKQHDDERQEHHGPAQAA